MVGAVHGAGGTGATPTGRNSVSRLLATTLTIASCVALLAGCGSNQAEQSENVKLASDVKKPSEAIEMSVTPVVQQTLSRDYELPGELEAYQDVAVYPKVQGFVKAIPVDRGSAVKKGQLLLTIFAPELDAKVRQGEAKVSSQQAALSQAESRLKSAQALVREGEAKLSADEATYNRLKKASATPGVVADNDVEVSKQVVEADKEHDNSLRDGVEAAQAMVRSEQQNVNAAKQELEAIRDTENYLVVRAPFDGVVTSRNVHEGSLVEPSMKDAMVRVQQLSKLRLVVPVPEVAVSAIKVGKPIDFSVPAFPGKKFVGVIARIGHSLDQHTRSMPVELDVANADGRLEPGMYPEVQWHVERPYATLFVPATAVATTTERTFVIRVTDGITEVVPVRKGQPMDNFVEIFGNLKAGDQVAVRASDDVKTGTNVAVKLAAATDLKPKEKEAGGE